MAQADQTSLTHTYSSLVNRSHFPPRPTDLHSMPLHPLLYLHHIKPSRLLQQRSSGPPLVGTLYVRSCTFVNPAALMRERMWWKWSPGFTASANAPPMTLSQLARAEELLRVPSSQQVPILGSSCSIQPPGAKFLRESQGSITPSHCCGAKAPTRRRRLIRSNFPSSLVIQGLARRRLRACCWLVIQVSGGG